MSVHINKKYSNILKKLIKLKNEFYASGIKLEFETEFLNQRDIYFAKKLALESELDLVVKIGGCGSVQDVEQAEKISSNTIVAPMIESRYALEKFFTTVRALCDVKSTNLYFNIETTCGYNHLDEILNAPCINEFEGIVFGRSDFAFSLGLPLVEVNSELISNFVNEVAKKVENSNLSLIIGGYISHDSKSFLKNIEGNNFKKIETRKIIFDKKIISQNFEQGLELALEFELGWLNSKDQKTVFDKKRIEEIERRLNKFVLV